MKSGFKYQLSSVWLQKGKHPSWSETSFLSRRSKSVIHYEVYGVRAGSTVHYVRIPARLQGRSPVSLVLSTADSASENIKYIIRRSLAALGHMVTVNTYPRAWNF